MSASNEDFLFAQEAQALGYVTEAQVEEGFKLQRIMSEELKIDERLDVILVKRGWLKAEWGVSEANQRAKYYRLTAAGKAQLSREHERWSQLVHAIGRIMNPAKAGSE